MPPFHETGLLSGFGYVTLIVFSGAAFFAGNILPLGLALLPLPFIVELALSIYFTKLSLENRRIHFLCFSAIIFGAALFLGMTVTVHKTKNTRHYLINTANTLEEYQADNNLDCITENDIDNIIKPENMRIEITGDTYRLFFRDGIYDSEIKKVYFRPRP